ncbi:MAG: excinuclease ABC subunit C, partial [Oscillospiraceae bacterium]|nr:excinuclease ABC subunit C [Oscillospiraceae bacterium]
TAVDRAVLILQGKTSGLIGSLKEEMEKAADELNFERAALLRDRIKAVNSVRERQMVLTGEGIDTDAVGFYRGQAKSCFAVLHYVSGKLLGKDWELLESPMEEDSEALSQLIRLFYSGKRRIPKRILLPFPLPDGDDIARLLEEERGSGVHIYTPQRGEKRVWLEAASENARAETERATTAEEKRSKTAEWLKNALGLEKTPERIEAFDVSNTAGADNVASMVVYHKGRPLKSAYRKFIIKTVQGQDDYASMTEAVSRRAARYNDGDAGFSPLPDIMLIDGGQEHARSAVKALNENGLTLPVFGMVKDDRHRTRALITPEGREIGISACPPVFAFIGSIQEEVHRFAIEFHRKKREKRSFNTELSGITGVGEKRIEALLKVFGSVKGVKAAEIEDLKRVLPAPAAAAVYERFHGEAEK